MRDAEGGHAPRWRQVVVGGRGYVIHALLGYTHAPVHADHPSTNHDATAAAPRNHTVHILRYAIEQLPESTTSSLASSQRGRWEEARTIAENVLMIVPSSRTPSPQ